MVVLDKCQVVRRRNKNLRIEHAPPVSKFFVCFATPKGHAPLHGLVRRSGDQHGEGTNRLASFPSSSSKIQSVMRIAFLILEHYKQLKWPRLLLKVPCVLFVLKCIDLVSLSL